jgi:hypothetical protein
MKNRTSRFLSSLGLMLLLLASYGNADPNNLDATALTGKWKGTYTCAKGLTGLTLFMTGNSSGDVEAIFIFYAVPQNPDAPSGSFRMRGVYGNDRSLVLNSDEDDWIERPSDHVTLDLNGSIPANSIAYTGNVLGAGGSCMTFSLTKQ